MQCRATRCCFSTPSSERRMSRTALLMRSRGSPGRCPLCTSMSCGSPPGSPSGSKAVPVRAAHHDRVAEGHLPIDLRDDQPEPCRRKTSDPGRPQWATVQQEEQQNEDLLRLSNQILELTRAIHAMSSARAAAHPASPDDSPTQASGPAETPGS